MMAALPLLAGLAAALVIVHMTRPYAARALLSAARFFWPVTPPSANRRRWRWTNPLRSRPLWLQFPAALLLLAALLLYNQTIVATPQTQALGVWLLLDTSASMSTQNGGQSRFDHALFMLSQVIAAATLSSQGQTLCFRLSTFDQELRHWLADGDAATVLARAAALQPRGLGTDLALVQNLAANIADQLPGCPITHLVVISDQPAPQTVIAAAPTASVPLTATASPTTAAPGVPLLWESVELTTANTGITAINAQIDPLSHQVIGVALQLTAYGPVPPTQLEITPPSATPLTVAPDWQAAGSQEQRWTYRLEQPTPGQYSFRLTADDGLAYDNRATIAIPAQTGIQVDWRMGDDELPRQLGWQQDAVAPALRVAAAATLDQLPSDATPLLLVGAGYGPPFPPAPIVEFASDSPLLKDVSFEQLERTGLAPFSTLATLPAGFTPVLTGGSGVTAAVWLAERQQPPAAYIPGLPLLPDLQDETWRTGALLFANALRGLLQDQPAPRLYTLTSPAEPEPSGDRLALHPEESNTMAAAGAMADLSLLSPQPAAAEKTPLWPWLVAAALLIVGVERNLAAWKGGRWC